MLLFCISFDWNGSRYKIKKWHRSLHFSLQKLARTKKPCSLTNVWRAIFHYLPCKKWPAHKKAFPDKMCWGHVSFILPCSIGPVWPISRQFLGSFHLPLGFFFFGPASTVVDWFIVGFSWLPSSFWLLLRWSVDLFVGLLPWCHLRSLFSLPTYLRLVHHNANFHCYSQHLILYNISLYTTKLDYIGKRTRAFKN